MNNIEWWKDDELGAIFFLTLNKLVPDALNFTVHLNKYAICTEEAFIKLFVVHVSYVS